MARYTLQFGRSFIKPGMNIRDWLGLMEFLYPEVERRREDSAILAREFYDSQRSVVHPELPRNDRPLISSDFRVFLKNMEPARQKVTQAVAVDDMGRRTDQIAAFLNRVERRTEAASTHLALQTVREVENAGRRQIISAVKEDQALEQKILNYKGQPVEQTKSSWIRGWARVATGRETCAWCLMLISRGPVYYRASRAGLDLDDESAQEMIAAGTDVTDYMEQWHAGCDCKVVPVFKNQDWPGQAAADAALELWKEATQEAREVLAENPDKVHLTGAQKGEPVTLNEEAINALRRRLDRGDISMTEFAAFAA